MNMFKRAICFFIIPKLLLAVPFLPGENAGGDAELLKESQDKKSIYLPYHDEGEKSFSPEKEDPKKKETSYLPGATPSPDLSKEKKGDMAPYVPIGEKKELSPEDLSLSDKQRFAEDRGLVHQDDLMKDSDEKWGQFHSGVASLGKTHFSWMVYRDDFDYNFTNKASFDRTFRGKGSSLPLMTTLLVQRFWWIYVGYFALGMEGGVGAHYGPAYFANGTKANHTKLYLWNFPLALMAHYELPLSPWFRLGIGGGPALNFLMQNRTDRDEGNTNKKIRYQLGKGYVIEAHFKWNYFALSKNMRQKFLRNYSITNGYLVFSGRAQKIERFKDPDLSVTGRSFGIGVGFDFL